MLRNINSIIGEIRESVIPWTKDPHKLDPKCDACIRIKGQDNTKTLWGSNEYMQLYVYIEVCLGLDQMKLNKVNI